MNTHREFVNKVGNTVNMIRYGLTGHEMGLSGKIIDWDNPLIGSLDAPIFMPCGSMISNAGGIGQSLGGFRG